MRILYDSKKESFKLPFGTLTEGQRCRIAIMIPTQCGTKGVELIFLSEEHIEYTVISLTFDRREGDYERYFCEFSLEERGLFFYYFRITTVESRFSLYKQGYNDTNIESGELWQLSCVPKAFKVPRELRGAVMYQIFPDRFYQSGTCDTTEKLKPFFIHNNISDIPYFFPNADGEVENNDFFGGNLKGIEAKLDYIVSLGVGVIYLNPIFKAYSNHRYDTADYMKIDELLGTEEDLRALSEAAHKRGIRIILDGVFSHTGSNSIYFDKLSVFGGGAYSDPSSQYRSWYEFKSYPEEYTSWWGIKTLPCVNENDESFRKYIVDGDDSVIAHWIRAGADGFRLDVADELPDGFILSIRKRMKAIKKDSFLIGEVWEDASNKVSYQKRRRYFVDGELDSVMNYPLREAIINYVKGKDSGEGFRDTVMNIAENYPRGVLECLMNILSTHDTERILTALSSVTPPCEKEARAGYKMSEDEREEAILRLRAATFLQFILPGIPCIFYGDEIGTEGYEDPFCRSCFDWDRVENNELLDYFRKISDLKNGNKTLKSGDLHVRYLEYGRICIERKLGVRLLKAYINTGDTTEIKIEGRVIFSERTEISCGEAIVLKYGFFLEEIMLYEKDLKARPIS